MNTPLTCGIEGDCLVVRIGIGTLAFVATHCEHFWDGESGTDVPCVKVDDDRIFAGEVVRHMTKEREDGSTLITDVIDKAIINAVEDGCEGVDHEV